MHGWLASLLVGWALTQAVQAAPANRVLRVSGNGYVDIPNSASLQVGSACTIEASVFLQVGGTENPRLFSKGWRAMEVHTLGTGPTRIIGLSANGREFSSLGALAADTWNHVAVVYDGASVSFYINGALDQVVAAPAIGPLNNTSRVNLGRNSGNGTDRVVGLIDEVRVWNRARTLDELQQTMGSRLSGTEPGLAAYWNFDDGTARDLTPNGNDGTLEGDATTTLGPIAYKDLVLQDGPVAYWRLDERSGQTARDSAGGHHGTYVNAVQLGLPGALARDADAAAGFAKASQGRVEVPYTAALNTPQFTAECWAFFTGRNSGWSPILASRDDAPQRGFIIEAGDDRWNFPIGMGAAGWGGFYGPAVQEGVWTYVAMTYDGATQRAFVNGLEVGSANIPYAPNTTQMLRIGAGGNDVADLFFEGHLDEVAIYSQALSPAQIRAHYNAGMKTTNLVLSLDGNNSVCSVPSAPALEDPDQITVEAWVYARGDDGIGNPYFLNKGESGGATAARTFALSFPKALGKFGFEIFTGQTGYSVIEVPAIPNQWVHLAFSYDAAAGVFNCYTNGQLAGTLTETVNGQGPLQGQALRQSPAAPLTIGSFNQQAGTFLDGLVDDVRIWRRALTQAEIADTMFLPLTGTEPGLAGYWNFDNGTARDLTGNLHDGTLTGGATIASAAAPPPVAGPHFVEIGRLPVPDTVERGEVFDAATRTLYSFPYYPPWGNALYMSHQGPEDTFTWAQTTPINYPYNYWGRGVSDGKRLYFTGPIDTFDLLSRVSFAPINSDGTLGAWRSTTPLPSPGGPRGRTLHQVVLFQGRMYVMGGWHGDGVPNYGDVWFAPMLGDGTLGSFTQTTALPRAMHGHSAVVSSEGRLYVAHASDVWVAPISATGPVGSFVREATITGMNHSNAGNNGMVLLGNLLIIVDRTKTFVCFLDTAGHVSGVVFTLDSPANEPNDWGERSVYAVDGKVYVTARTGKIYRIDDLTADLPPTITEPPHSQTVNQGDAATFTVTVFGREPLSYQWRFNGTNIPAATNTTFTLANAQLADAGKYSVEVSNALGAPVSGAATLSVRVINRIPNQVLVSTLAGPGLPGYAEGTGEAAQFNSPNGGWVSAFGYIYVADARNQRIRRVSPTGQVITVAGSGQAGYLDGPGASAQFKTPQGVCVGLRGEIFVADAENNLIRNISPLAARTVGTVSGTGQPGYRDGTVDVAQFDFPNDLVMDDDGNLFVTEFHNHTVRKVTPDGTASTFVGNGVAGTADGVGTAAGLNQPAGIARGQDGTLYVTEWGSHRIRKVAPDGTVTTLAGNGTPGYVDGPGATAQFNSPDGIAVDLQNNLYVVEHWNHAVRRITPAGLVQTVAGTGLPGYVNGDGAQARFTDPGGIGLAPDGTLYIADTDNHRIRKVELLAPPPPRIREQPQGATIASGQPFTLSVQADGSGHLTYQWQHNGQNIPGATNTSYTLSQVQRGNTGAYSVVVSNEGVPLPSDAAIVRLVGGPAITTQPQPTDGVWGRTVSFTVAATGDEPLRFQWFKDTAPIPEATQPALTLTNLALEAGGVYAVTVSNAVDSVASVGALLTIKPANLAAGLYAGIAIDGAVGKTYAVRYITNLAQTNFWIPLATVTLTNSVQVWVDTDANTLSTNRPQRFYQVLPLP
jgi:sugar lactone lactonase YvrE